MEWQQTVDDLESRWGLTAFVHASDLSTGREVGVRPDESVVAASVFKVPVLVEACRQMADGTIDPTRRIDLSADDFAVLGPTGITVFSDPVSLSFRDLCLSMMTVSDNRATDVVMDLVGLDRINAAMDHLGLSGTYLEGNCADLFAQMWEDLGLEPGDEDSAKLKSPHVADTRPLDPHRSNRTTPRETTELFRRLWTDDGIPPDACAEARRILGLQVWPHRLRSGFPDDDVIVSGKTGTLAFVRNEVGVVEYPDGGRYAVAVFLRLPVADLSVPHFDRAIGTIAAAAVDALRSP